MNRNNALAFGLCTIALLAALTPGAVYASTPDGETPAVEEICSDHAGAAFGLCNAYCEAMDCHLGWDFDATTTPKASPTACAKVESRFFQITGEPLECAPGGSDPACPTGTEGCPCGDGEYQCDDELSCDEGDRVCTSGGGGDV